LCPHENIKKVFKMNNVNRRGFLKVVGSGIAGVASHGMAHAAPATAKPPNVVLIISDDQGYTDYGFMGHDLIKTPHRRLTNSLQRV